MRPHRQSHMTMIAWAWRCLATAERPEESPTCSVSVTRLRPPILAEAGYSESGVGFVGVAPLSVNVHGDSVKIAKEYGYVGELASAPTKGGVETVTWPAIETKQTGVPVGSPRS